MFFCAMLPGYATYGCCHPSCDIILFAFFLNSQNLTEPVTDYNSLCQSIRGSAGGNELFKAVYSKLEITKYKFRR